MISDEFALHLGCSKNPTDNTARLIYADYLDEMGTTDRQASHSEWIRLTCTKPREFYGTRQAGEPKWIRDNWRRLWPTVANRLFSSIPEKAWKLPSIELPSAGVDFRLPVLTTGEGRERRVDISVVRMLVRRGIAQGVIVTFLRAKQLAPYFAADEPFTPIRFSIIPDRVLYRNPYNGAILVDRKAFELRGMLDLWNDLEGWTEMGGTGELPGKVYSPSLHNEPAKAAAKAINDALTRWARRQAGVPHMVPPEMPVESQETLTVPPRV